jgi:hypothetical protein
VNVNGGVTEQLEGITSKAWVMVSYSIHLAPLPPRAVSF